MGMEEYQEPVVAEEPVIPDESQRVDDVEKAQEMAEASNSSRSGAVENRKIAAGEVDGPRMAAYGPEVRTSQDARDFHAKKAESLDDLADRREDVAGQKFEMEKQVKLEKIKKELGME